MTAGNGGDGATHGAIAGAGLNSPALLTAPIAAYAVDLDGRVCLFNHAAEAMFGWTADEVIGRYPPFVTLEERDRAFDALARVTAGEDVTHELFSPIRRTGLAFRALCSGTIVRGHEGEPVAALTLVRDVTDEMEADELRRAAEHKWRQLAMHTAERMSIVDREGVIIEVAGASRPPLGYPPGWWEGKNGFEVVHPDDMQRMLDDWAELVPDVGGRMRRVYRVRHHDGHYEQMEFTAVNMLDDPIVHGVIVTSRIVSAQQQAESLVADEARVLELVARDAPLAEVLDEIVRIVEYHTGGACGVLLVDEDEGIISMASQGSIPDELLELVRRTPLDTARRRDKLALAADRDIGSHAVAGFAVRQPVVVTDFATHPLTASFAQPVLDLGFHGVWSTPIIENRTDTLYGLVATYVREPRAPSAHETKVTDAASHLAAIAVERAGWQSELWELARYDALTSLPNRSLIFEQLDDALNRARARGVPVTVMLIDLDRFKLINDSLGHQIGDHLIAEFATRLRSTVGEEHFVGRIGADEFVIIFPPGVRVRDAQLTAARVAKALEEPFAGAETGDIFLTSSIGIAMAESGRENAETLLQQADAAMYRAKALGRDRTEVFDERLRSRAVTRLELDRDLRLALERNELELYYQPEIDCRTGCIVGAEALLRWHHPERGLIAPDGFIHLAEETGVIVPIGHWVLDEAVRQARLWTDADPSIEPFAVSVNLSARQLINRSLVDTVAFVLTRYNWPPSLLTLELTESILIEDRDSTLFVLNRLRLLGVKLSIDDFGTGFASLDYLHRLHVDSIKIDRSFVTMLDATGSGSPVATAMMHMAKAFDLTVTAEGVEEATQYAGLKAIECDLAQGFLFARPIPAAEMNELLTSHQTW